MTKTGLLAKSIVPDSPHKNGSSSEIPRGQKGSHLGRTKTLTPALMTKICELVRTSGMPKSRIAALVGLHHSTLDSHLSQHPEDAMAVEQASAGWQYEVCAKLQAGDYAHPSQMAWLLSKHIRFYGDKLAIEHTGEITHKITPEFLADIREKRRRALESDVRPAQLGNGIGSNS